MSILSCTGAISQKTDTRWLPYVISPLKTSVAVRWCWWMPWVHSGCGSATMCTRMSSCGLSTWLRSRCRTSRARLRSKWSSCRRAWSHVNSWTSSWAGSWRPTSWWCPASGGSWSCWSAPRGTTMQRKSVQPTSNSLCNSKVTWTLNRVSSHKNYWVRMSFH